MSGNRVVVTKAEQNAIGALKRLAKRWPKTLTLFSCSGTLVVMKEGPDGRLCSLSDFIHGIPNDGGDPGAEEVDQFAIIEREGGAAR